MDTLTYVLSSLAQVSGDVTLDQLLVSLRVYAERDGMIEHVAFRLFEIVELGHVPSLHNELVQVY